MKHRTDESNFPRSAREKEEREQQRFDFYLRADAVRLMTREPRAEQVCRDAAEEDWLEAQCFQLEGAY